MAIRWLLTIVHSSNLLTSLVYAAAFFSTKSSQAPHPYATVPKEADVIAATYETIVAMTEREHRENLSCLTRRHTRIPLDLYRGIAHEPTSIALQPYHEGSATPLQLSRPLAHRSAGPSVQPFAVADGNSRPITRGVGRSYYTNMLHKKATTLLASVGLEFPERHSEAINSLTASPIVIEIVVLKVADVHSVAGDVLHTLIRPSDDSVHKSTGSYQDPPVSSLTTVEQVWLQICSNGLKYGISGAQARKLKVSDENENDDGHLPTTIVAGVEALSSFIPVLAVGRPELRNERTALCIASSHSMSLSDAHRNIVNAPRSSSCSFEMAPSQTLPSQTTIHASENVSMPYTRHQVPMAVVKEQEARLLGAGRNPTGVNITVPIKLGSTVWAVNVTFSNDGSLAHQTMPAMAKPPDMDFVPATTTEAVCQNKAIHQATITPRPSISAAGYWVSELSFSKTDGRSVCGAYPARIARCMNRYTSAYTKLQRQSFSQTGLQRLSISPNDGRDVYRSGATTIMRPGTGNHPVTISGPHWGVPDPKAMVGIAVREDCEGRKYCIEPSCDSEESCIEYCEKRKTAELRFLSIIGIVFVSLLLLCVVGIAFKKSMSKELKLDRMVKTNAPRAMGNEERTTQ